jgi:SAM-dependent methyltransferase
MAYSATDLEAYVRQQAPEIAQSLRNAAQKAKNEADLVAEAEKILDRFIRSFDVTLHLERERTLINGRADAVYNRFVIEYEPPGSLRQNNTHGHNQHAIGQVKQYMEGLERLDRHRKERLAGVVLDGSFFIFVRYRDDLWRIDDPLPVTPHSTETFLRYLLSLSTELALTPGNLVRDFGENSNTARQVVPALFHALQATDNPKVDILFRQWQRQFQEVSGYNSTAGQIEPAELARLYAVRDRSPDMEKLFFAIHTYYASFIKLLALQVAHYYLMPKIGTGLAALANQTSDKLRASLIEMEHGGLFAQLGIRNFLEGDFFGWYLDIWDEALDAALRRLVADLSNYSLVTLDVDPEETRDLLKQLYQNLMPKKLRHALGEYYTPDWLADHVLNQLGYGGDPGKRLLDPACGSGTFLVLAIKRVRQYTEEKMLPPDRVLEQVLGNIVGFDLNPLAVISARTNYLLALGDLLSYRQGEISIPVYLADSILTPSQGDELYTYHTYGFNTVVGRFTVPRSLVDSHYIDQLANLLEECVHNDIPPDQFKARLLKSFPLDITKDDAEINVAMELYEQLLKLEHQGINGVWARIIKNAFAPLFQGRFDYIAGNPPWVNWESLPGEYRQETAQLWTKHDLFPHKGFDAILGNSQDDISILLTYVALFSYLKNGGQLGFVITQSVFKTAGGGKGFRKFQLADGTPIKVVIVEDMVDLMPFEGASNRTAVVILQRDHQTMYPVSYNLWRRKVRGQRIREDVTCAEALAMCTISPLLARPVDTKVLTSSWISGRSSALKAIEKLIGPSPYKARKGIALTLNGAFWVEILSNQPGGTVVVSNITERAKKPIESVQAVIESDLVYPLLRGQNVSRWRSETPASVIVTHEPRAGLKAIPEKDMAIKWPKTYQYLKRFEGQLRASGIFRRYFRETAPFYSIFDIGEYTFSPYKMVFRYIASELTCAVIGSSRGKVVIPDHKLVLCPFDTELEAHFVCATLNSSLVRFVVGSYSIETQFSTHVLEHIAVPKFDQANPLHCQLAGLSQQAHHAAASGDLVQVQAIEEKIDQLSAQLWKLSDEELREIQESLKELG